MLAFLGVIALASAPLPQAAQAADPCAEDPNCRRASAPELFAAADALAGEGDLEAAEGLLQALTADPGAVIRAEARFRLASIRERRGDLAGAIAALRDLLEEQPGAQRARLELSRILAAHGEDEAARQELRRAASAGLPYDVARTVRRFSSALNSLKRRGAYVEMAISPDSNINRATSDQFVDTIIAPFELDPNARATAAVGAVLAGEAWSRRDVLGADLLTRGGFRGDFFLGKSQFNDAQLSLSTGPDLTTSIGRIRPALTHERRWYGGRTYSTGYGGSLNWVLSAGPQGQVQVDASVVRQSIRRNAVLDGHRYAVIAAYDRTFTPETSGRLTIRAAALDAAVRPESLRLAGGDALIAHIFPVGTAFAQASYTRTEGRAPLALFGKTRKDDRFDLGAGMVLQKPVLARFAPLARLILTNSRSNLELYDFRRARLELGIYREF